MAYRLKADESVADAVVRIARRQTDRSLAALGPGLANDPLAAIFEVRRRCKKVRSVARLVRPLVGSSYDEVNRCYREAGRLLAVYRDPVAQLAALDELLVVVESDPPAQLLERRAHLRNEVAESEAQLLGDGDRLARVDELLRVGRLRLDRWQLSATGWDAIEPGLVRNYRQSRRALRLADDEPTPYNVHEFRKYAKHLRNHLRLLEPAAPAELGPLVEQLRELTSALGQAHDLSQLAEWLDATGADSGESGPEAASERNDVGQVIRVRQRALERRGLELGHRLHHEPPTDLGHRLGQHWWR